MSPAGPPEEDVVLLVGTLASGSWGSGPGTLLS